MTNLITRTQIRDMLKAGTITREAAIARCDEILAREGVRESKRVAWANLRQQVVAGGAINVAATFAHLQPTAKPAKPEPKTEAKAEAKPADAPKPKRNTKGIDAASLARAANLLAAQPELMAAFAQMIAAKR